MNLNELIAITAFIFWTAWQLNKLAKRIEALEARLAEATNEAPKRLVEIA